MKIYKILLLRFLFFIANGCKKHVVGEKNWLECELNGMSWKADKVAGGSPNDSLFGLACAKGIYRKNYM